MFDWWSSAEALTKLNFIVQISGAIFGFLIVSFGIRLSVIESRDRRTVETAREKEAKQYRERIEQSEQKAAALSVAIAPRRLSTSQIEASKAHLANAARSKIEIEVPMEGEDSMDLADQLRNVLRGIGYEVADPYFSTRFGVKGLNLEIKETSQTPSAAGFLQQAFRAIGYPCEAHVNSGVGDDTTRLIVGPK